VDGFTVCWASEFERTLYWRMRNRYRRAVRRGGWKYLKVAEREFLFDIDERKPD
jgi:hypothetical protein